MGPRSDNELNSPVRSSTTQHGKNSKKWTASAKSTIALFKSHSKTWSFSAAQELEAFENNLVRITNKRFISDLPPSHVGPLPSVSSLRILPSRSSFIPPWPSRILPSVSFNTGQRGVVGKYENRNLLEIEEREKPVPIARIQGVYRKAVIHM